MGDQHASSAGTAPASLVGNAFVNRYYKIVHQTPQLGYRFYTEESRITRAEPLPETTVEPTTSLSGINEKIMSWDYHAMRTEIITVDSQESLAGHVLVMVTGALYTTSGLKRMFVQTFVLVPHQKRYYIYNDMFRFLDGGSKPNQHLSSQVAVNKSNLHDSAASAALDRGIKETNLSLQPSERTDIGANTDVLTSQYSSSREQEDVPAEDRIKPTLETQISDAINGTLAEGCAAEIITQGQVGAIAPKPNEYPDALMESNVEAPKKSYASILRSQKEKLKVTNSVNSTPNNSKVTPTHTERSTSLGASQPVPSGPSQAPLGAGLQLPDSMEEISTNGAEVGGRSVYVKSLPLNVTVVELEQEFNKFGPLKTGGINLCNQRIGVCFAFIDFQEASSAQRATEASPLIMNGRQVYVEEKRVIPPSRGSRGRPYQGRGYQNTGMRARGFYGNGRGISRVQMDSERDFGSGRGRGVVTSSSRGGYSGGNSNISNTFRRPDNQNGGTFRPVRRAGNQMGRNGHLARPGIVVAAG